MPVHLDQHTVAFCDPRGPVDHLDVRYAAVATERTEARVSDESLAVRWWTLDVLPALEPEMRELVVQARERCGAWDELDQSPEPSSRAPIE
jgi:hypothetical protein